MVDNFIIAQKLFGTLQLSFSVATNENTEELRIVSEILKSTRDRQGILDRVIDLIGDAKKPEEKFLKAKALSWSRIHRNKEAIIALEDALKEDVAEEHFSNIRHIVFYPYISNKNEIEKRIFLSDMRKDLSDKYLKEYEFDKALHNAHIAFELTPFYAHIVIQVCTCYIRKNELQRAKRFCEQVINGDFYNLDTKALSESDFNYLISYQRAISVHYNELLTKIKKGYVYKPRPRKK